MRKIVQKVKRILSVLMIAALLTQVSGFNSYAAGAETEENDIEVEVLEAKIIEEGEWNSGISLYTMLVDCKIIVCRKDDGMCINLTVGTTKTASVLGVKDIKIWQKNSQGKWDLVATSNGGESYNCASGGVSVTYPNAVLGATYKITCVHYGDVNGMEEYSNDSGEFKYNFPISNQ